MSTILCSHLTMFLVLVGVISNYGVNAQDCSINQVYGCHIDTIDPRTMPWQTSNADSLEQCAQNCFNDGYFGTAGAENGEECWCSTASDGVGDTTDQSECSKLCPGNTAENCGGESRLNEFSFHCNSGPTPPPTPPPSPPPPGPPPTPPPPTPGPPSPPGHPCKVINVYGCFIDTIDPRTMPWQASNADTLEGCATNCFYDGYYGTAGVENAEECWCSTASGGVGDVTDQSECSKLCPGNTSESCGGESRLSEFSFICNSGPPPPPPTPPPMPPPPPPHPTPPPPGPPSPSIQCAVARQYGCYVDTVVPRTLPYQAADANSLDKCGENCYHLGFTGTAGVENGNECWCSAAFGSIGTEASLSECNKPCSDSSSTKCGGLSRLSEFAFTCEPAVPRALPSRSEQ